MRYLVSIALTLMLALPVAAQDLPAAVKDFYNGLAAYARGDYSTAQREFGPLAEQGHIKAQLFLGSMYDEGRGVPQDYAEAVKWYRKAAEQGDASAQSSLGVMYANGDAVPQDYVQAHMWFNLAAAQGWNPAVQSRDWAAERMPPANVLKAQRLAREWMAKHEK